MSLTGKTAPSAATEQNPILRQEGAMTRPMTDLVTPEVVQKIRSENQVLLRTARSIQAGIETGRFDEAARDAAELGHVVRKHVLLVDGVLDVLSPDDIVNIGHRR